VLPSYRHVHVMSRRLLDVITSWRLCRSGDPG